MQFSRNFSALALFVLALAGAGMTTPLTAPGESVETAADAATYLVSHDEMMHWIKTTDAELTFVGEPLNPLARRSEEATMVTYCTTRIGNTCGGACTVYNGGAACLAAPNTNCLAATNTVGYCTGAGCAGNCGESSNCISLDNGFCYTPNTLSILVTAN